MNISQNDYEQQRHIFDFCRWINQKLYELEKEPDFEQIYFERTSINLKKLLEEAIPISHLGLYLCREWQDVFVQCFTNTPQYDAKIEICTPSFTNKQERSETDIDKKVIKVEITTTENDESAMRRQALSRNGFVHFTGTVKREGRDIISDGEFVDVNEESLKIVQLALERLTHKLNNQYDETTAILIYITADRSLSSQYRLNLLEGVKGLLQQKRPTLYGVFICYKLNLGVDGIINKLPFAYQ